MSALRSDSVRRVGWYVLVAVLAFGAGNYHTTKEAVDGSARWWQGHERRTMTATQQKDYNACYEQWTALEHDKAGGRND